MTPRDYLKQIIRPPAHQGWPHVNYNDWMFCKVCAPHYRKYLNEKKRLTAQGEKILLPSNFKM